MARIEDLLHRRPDLSTFLVHLTREGEKSPVENLVSMLTAEKIVAGPGGFGQAKKYEERLAPHDQTQRVVCFTETPLEHVWALLEDIEGRQLTFSSYGVVITKTAGRKLGCNPVWYTDMTPRGGRDWLSRSINELIDAAVADHESDDEGIASEQIFSLTPFVEQMGPMNNGRRKEFWWEREWRHRDDFGLRPDQVVALLAPEEHHEDLRSRIEEEIGSDSPWLSRSILDPRWGLERMIAALAGVDEEYVGPFPRR